MLNIDDFRRILLTVVCEYYHRKIFIPFYGALYPSVTVFYLVLRLNVMMSSLIACVKNKQKKKH